MCAQDFMQLIMFTTMWLILKQIYQTQKQKQPASLRAVSDF